MTRHNATAAVEEPLPLHRYAEENLVFIRDAMARSSSFTAVSGYGLILMGLAALAGAWIASQSASHDGWVNTWGFVVLAGSVIGVVSMYIKARLRRLPVWSAPGRKFVMSFTPAILAGYVLSETFYWHHLDYLMPPMWLMLYGVAVMNGGAYSVKPVPVTGLLFLLLGAAAAFYPLDLTTPIDGFLLRDVFLAVGFGGLHIALGIIVALRYGG
jgi:hypothetical protein